MENEKEALRLDIKTNETMVKTQAVWAGVSPGMRVADLGCGSGKTTSILAELVQPRGEVIGVDIASKRIEYARANYGSSSIEFHQRDIRESLSEFGEFDLLWVRFVLEYYQTQACSIIQNIYRRLRPGGTICLIDLDYNCLSHHGLSSRLESKLKEIVSHLQKRFDFDPFVGRKLYSYLHDIGCEEIDVNLSAHHLIYGKLKESDLFNWTCKLEAAKPFFDSEEAYRDFYDEFLRFFADPRRFTYTPLIICKGKKPTSQLNIPHTKNIEYFP